MKKILSIVILVAMLATGICAFADKAETTTAAPAEPAYVSLKDQVGPSIEDKKDQKIEVTAVSYKANGKLAVTVANKGKADYIGVYAVEGDEKTKIAYFTESKEIAGKAIETKERLRIRDFSIPAGETVVIEEKIISEGKAPVINMVIQYYENGKTPQGENDLYTIYKEDIIKLGKGAGTSAFFGTLADVALKVGTYLLHNIIAIIALILSCIVLIKSKKKAVADCDCECECNCECDCECDCECEDDTIDAASEEAVAEEVVAEDECEDTTDVSEEIVESEENTTEE